MQAVSYSSSPTAAHLSGPSDDTGLFVRSLLAPRGGVFLEDALTESELRLLCGTYKVKKARFPSCSVMRLWKAFQATISCTIRAGRRLDNGRLLLQTLGTGVPEMSVGL